MKNRLVPVFLSCIMIVSLCACQNAGKLSQNSYLVIEKDGSVESTIHESFDENTYQIEELKNMILREVTDYNQKAAGEVITVDKILAKDGLSDVVMGYRSAKDYEAFNHETLFLGTALQADSEGYDLNVVLSDAKDTNQTIGRSDILAMTSEKLLITDTCQTVIIDGKILYASEGAVLSDNLKSFQMKTDENGNHLDKVYIIYK